MTYLLGRLRCTFCGDSWRALWLVNNGASPGRQCPTCSRAQAGVPEGLQLEAAGHPHFGPWVALLGLQAKQMQRFHA